jgi:hypothetical protein
VESEGFQASSGTLGTSEDFLDGVVADGDRRELRRRRQETALGGVPFREAHHDGVAFTGGTAKPLPEFVFAFDHQTTGFDTERRSGEIGAEFRIVREGDGRAAFLIGV